MMMAKTEVAVLGAGFSATATIINLLEHLPPEKSVAVASADSSFGLGTAYSTTDDGHRLNVSAARMSLYADRPDHLVEWLDREGHPYGPEDFVPRKLYGKYIQDSLSKSLQQQDNRARVTFLGAEAIDCEQLDCEAQRFSLGNGRSIEARHSVLCLGGTPAGLPIPPDAVDPAARPYISVNAWGDNWLERTDPQDTVFLLGSGLTMIDQVLSLKRQGHEGRIHVLSRHGLTPRPHIVPRSHPTEPVLTPGAHPLSEMLHILRRETRDAADWRSVIDGLRPVTQSLWQKLDEQERRRFFRHANAWWSVHRHRMAPQIAEAFHDMERSGQVEVHAGWLQAIREYQGQARIAYRDRHTGTLKQVSAAHFVNCTGIEKCSISKVPLLKKMSAKAMIAPDPMGLGLALSPQSELITPDGSTITSAYAMGPMAVGQFFEIFAVPDIRVQARKVAEKIALAA
jgi:uncharacterized NAD(P)/FAD-binding protein YdhS